MQVIKCVADKLSTLHDAGVVHGSLQATDVVWLRRTQAWTIVDFSSTTTCGHFLNMPASMSERLAHPAPEVVELAHEGASVVASEGLDCWALGLLAFKLLSEEELVDDDPCNHNVRLYW